jgi:hypothetical protein
MLDFLSTASLKFKLGLRGEGNSPCRNARINFRNRNGIILLECKELQRREREPFIVDDSTLPAKGKKV